jgi:hypothetical protein
MEMVDLPQDWESGAAARAKLIEISLDDLFAARDQVRGAMGLEWFEQQERKLARSSANIAHVHPLYRQLTSPNDIALVDVAELAFYLRVFKGDPAITEIVNGLRGSKFWATLFELAMAYRWRDAGAVVRLSPVTAKGRADFAANAAGVDVIVEVSRFDDDVIGGPQFSVPLAITDAGLRVIPESIPFVYKVRVSGPVEARLETPLRRALKTAGIAFVSEVQAGNQRFAATYDAIDVEIETLDANSEDIPVIIDEHGRQVSTRSHDWNVMFRIPDEEGGERARFFIQFENSPRVFSDDVLPKVKKELDQLGGTRTPSVVMIDLSRYGDLDGLPLQSLAPGLRDLLRQHQRCTSVWFLTRLWTSAFRHKYRWTYFANPFSARTLPEAFLNRLIEREWKWDFLGGKEYQIGTEEEDMRRYRERMPR